MITCNSQLLLVTLLCYATNTYLYFLDYEQATEQLNWKQIVAAVKKDAYSQRLYESFRKKGGF